MTDLNSVSTGSNGEEKPKGRRASRKRRSIVLSAVLVIVLGVTGFVVVGRNDSKSGRSGALVTSNSTYKNVVTVTGKNISQPIGMAVSTAEAVYFVDSNNHRVMKRNIGSTQGFVKAAGGNGEGSNANQFSYPFGMALDAALNVYVADTDNNRVQKWVPGASEGVTVAGGNGQGSGANQLIRPSGVAVDGSGNLYVTDSGNGRLQRWAPGATAGVTFVASPGPGVAVDASGNVYVAELNNDRVQKWSAACMNPWFLAAPPDFLEQNPSFLESQCPGTTVAGGNGTGSGTNQFNRPSGLAVDASGSVYVADTENGRVQKWAANCTSACSGVTVAGGNGNGPDECTSTYSPGQYQSVCATDGSAANQLYNPMGVAVDTSGNVWVADTDNNRVQKWSP